ncbi:MAG: sigma-54-dependent Fis family transcriptional regulator [Planctomycetes bacterium]|nr:sigma-54-dependent Fis family transcriptional regulator [Planctomycetota bacterium]
MALFDADALPRARRLSQLVYCNPFLSERIEHERSVLGADFDEATADWNLHADWPTPLPNIERLAAISVALADAARERLTRGHRPDADDCKLYEDVVLLALYYERRPQLDRVAAALENDPGHDLADCWDEFAFRAHHYLDVATPRPDGRELARLFAFFLQISRAFHRVFDCIIGTSGPAVRLRAQVWQSIFTHDLERYRRTLYERMGDHATLITGPSGTGKELVARAVGQSRFVPFDPRTRRLTPDPCPGFHALNLSALGAQLVEAELFGHKRGAFTGAVSDREGWLETCPPHGCVFLDEIGEIEPAIQVKLLRVLEERTFHRVGETRDRRFAGKLVAATNRDLAHEMAAGRFRTDLYYRLCSDTIRTPSLHERFADDGRERRVLLEYLAGRLVGDDAADLADEVEAWIDGALGTEYRWPGNVRELEQCVRNVMIRGEYHPAEAASGTPPRDDAWAELAAAMHGGGLPADELLRRYVELVHRETGSLSAAAQRLRLDRRTVRARLGTDPN